MAEHPFKTISSNVPAFAVVLLAACLLIAATVITTYGAITFGVAIYNAHVVSPRWPTTTGKILSSSAAQGCGRGKSYYLDVSYGYMVSGRSFRNDRISFGSRYCRGKEDVEAVAAKYDVGAPVDVYFDPEAPSQSVLVRGRTENGTVLGFMLLLCAPLGLIYLAFKVLNAVKRVEAQSVARREALDRGIRVEVAERQDKSPESDRRVTDA